MFSFSYPARFRKDEDRRPVVSFPDFAEARTDGKDMLEAMEEAIDCLGSTIAFRIRDKQVIPVPSTPKRGERLVPVPLWIAGKLALYLAMRERKVNNSELARLLGVRETIVRRMLDPDHDTKAERLHAALSVLGKRLTVAVEDACLSSETSLASANPASQKKCPGASLPRGPGRNNLSAATAAAFPSAAG